MRKLTSAAAVMDVSPSRFAARTVVMRCDMLHSRRGSAISETASIDPSDRGQARLPIEFGNPCFVGRWPPLLRKAVQCTYLRDSDLAGGDLAGLLGMAQGG